MAARSVAVIGAGIIGTVAACFLRREGHEVTLYDRDAPGSGASFGNSGVLSPAAVMPVAMPGLIKKVPRWLLDETGPLYLDWRELPRLVPWLIAFLRAGREDRVRAISAALAALNGPTLDLLMPLLHEAGLDALVQRRGMLYVDPIGQESAGDGLTVSLQRAAGHRVEVLDAGGLRDLEPALAPGFTRGVFVPAAAHTLDPHRLVTGLAEYFERQGGSLRRARVDRILAAESDHAAIEAGGERHDHDVVVVAAGVWSKPLVAGLGYPVPLVAQRGYHVTFTNPGVALGRVVLPLAHAATIVPMAMGIRIGGTVEFAAMVHPRTASAPRRSLVMPRPRFPLSTSGSARRGWARGRARRTASPCSAGRRAIRRCCSRSGMGTRGSSAPRRPPRSLPISSPKGRRASTSPPST